MNQPFILQDEIWFDQDDWTHNMRIFEEINGASAQFLQVPTHLLPAPAQTSPASSQHTPASAQTSPALSQHTPASTQTSPSPTQLLPATQHHDAFLKLPPTPKRAGKRTVKRTHPVSEGNIEEMKDDKTKKQKLEMEKKVRQMTRIEKQKNNIKLEIEKAMIRKQKDDEKLQRLIEKQNKM